ncbi:uncharacterized protein CBL_03809 [Carabus blaptoides fortunei]
MDNTIPVIIHLVWESSAHSPVGALTGNTHQLGHFDECLHSQGPFRVQYCLANVEVHIPKILRDKYSVNYQSDGSAFDKFYVRDRSRVPRNLVYMGICVPAVCSHTDIEEVLNAHFKLLNEHNHRNLSYTATVNADTCQTDRSDERFTAGDIIFCLLMSVILIMVIVCTVYDLRQKEEFITKTYSQPLSKRLLLCFSAVRNFADLPRRDDSNPALGILYGMRTLCICMIIIDHRCGTFITGPIFNREFVEEHYRSFASLFIFHGDLFVDSFFVLSGLLVTYSLLVSFEKRITSPILIVFNRYVRLTPIFALVAFFYATMLYKTGSGPLWKSIVGNMQADCQHNWWTAILYLSNYVNDANMCMVHSWYLPCDFHYFILAIPTILLLRRKQQTGLGLMFIALIISFLIPLGLTMYYERPALLHFYLAFLSAPKVHPDFRLTYTKSHTRATAYIIGMFTGYAYYKLRNSTVKLSLVKSTALTVIGLLLMFGGMASGGVFYDPYHSYNVWEAALYAGLHRPAWAVGSAILLLNASYGRFGIMKAFLEWEPWIPLSKLVYGAYLVHMCWQLRSTAMVKSPRYLNELNVITLALGDIVLSFALALILYIMVEAPCRKLFREIMSPSRKRPETKPDDMSLRERAATNGNEDSHL